MVTIDEIMLLWRAILFKENDPNISNKTREEVLKLKTIVKEAVSKRGGCLN